MGQMIEPIVRCGVIASLIFSASAIAQDAQYEVNFDVGVAASDNIGRTPDTEVDPALDETILLGGMDFLVVDSARRWVVDLRGSISHYQYQDETYDDETLSTINGSGRFVLAEDYLDWDIQANHGQQILNPFEPITPENRENVTFVSTGPRFSVPLGVRTYLTGNVSISDVTYEVRPIDNSRLGAGLGLSRAIAPTKTLSLNASVEEIEYEESSLFAPIDRQNYYLAYEVEGARSQLTANLGWTVLERAEEQGDGYLLELNWTRELSALSTFTLNAGSNYSTDGDIFRLNQELDDINRGTQDVQGIDDPFRHDYIRLRYSLNGTRTTFSIGIHMDREAYESSTILDRDLEGINILLRRDITPSLQFSLFGGYIGRDYNNLSSNDDELRYGASISWSIARTVSIELRAENWTRETSTASNEFEENRAMLKFIYTPVSRR